MSDFSIEITYNSDFGSFGSGNGEFNNPSRATILNNELFVVDKQNHRIQVFDLSGAYIRQFGSLGSGNDNFSFPEGITNDGTDLYITDAANNRVKKHQVDGTFLLAFGTFGSGNDNFYYPVGIDFDGTNLFIVDKQNHRVKIHQLNGTYLSQFGSLGTGNQNFNFPEGIAISNNDVIVADSANKQVKRFTTSGSFLSKINDTTFGYPVGITNIDDDVFCVTDRIKNKILFFDKVNLFIDEYGEAGSGQDDFSFPISAAYEDDQLFIVDSANSRVKKLDIEVIAEEFAFKDVLVKITKQLYPTGRAWWLKLQNTFYLLHEGLALSESRALQNDTDILNSILPDNPFFTEEDAFNWENALGLFIQPSLDLEERKAAILRRMKHPGEIPARQHYLYLQGQLQAVGFNVYVHENRIDAGGGQYEIINVIDALYDNFKYDETLYDNAGIGDFSIIANYVSESKDAGFVFGSDVNLRSTFFIGGVNLGDRADILETRKDEFRHLILTIKPAQTSGFLLIDYI